VGRRENEAEGKEKWLITYKAPVDRSEHGIVLWEEGTMKLK
jgi:hypothetical protein